jgi:hypothetical protein
MLQNTKPFPLLAGGKVPKHFKLSTLQGPYRAWSGNYPSPLSSLCNTWFKWLELAPFAASIMLRTGAAIGKRRRLESTVRQGWAGQTDGCYIGFIVIASI